MNNSSGDSPKKTKKYNLYRTCVFYTGKFAGQAVCSFVKAKSKEDADKFVSDSVVRLLKQQGKPIDCFKTQTYAASQEEMDFFNQSLALSIDYKGIVN